MCRYMLYDAFSSTAVDVSAVTLRITLRGAQQTVHLPCVTPSTAYSADTGGDCDAVIPSSLTAPGQVAILQASLEVVAANGTVIAESARSAVDLAGVPAQSAPLARSGFMFAPYREVYPGEAVRMAVFADSDGQRAGGFQVQVQFDGAVLQYSGYELNSAWKVRRCVHTLALSLYAHVPEGTHACVKRPAEANFVLQVCQPSSGTMRHVPVCSKMFIKISHIWSAVCA